MYRILDILKKEIGFISGEEIGKRLEISRAAIWKGIKKLREEGYEIEAVTNKGYRLVLHETMYNEKEILSDLKTKKMGKKLYFYKEVGSTNDVIRQFALDGAEEGVLAITEMQNNGRGRRGKPWVGPAGTGIWMSLLLRPHIHPSEASVLTLIMGLAVQEAIQKVAGISADIKWPNDVLIDNKKLVGILTELDCEINEVQSVTIGVGINVNTTVFPEEIADIATSLYLASGRTFSRKMLVHEILQIFEVYYDRFLTSREGFAPFLDTYAKKCITLGKKVRVEGRVSFLATAVSVTPQGELLVRREDDGKEEVVFSGEVSIRGGQ